MGIARAPHIVDPLMAHSLHSDDPQSSDRSATWWRLPIGRSSAALLLALLLASCGRPQSVDGWPIGAEIPCEFQTLTSDAAAVVANEFVSRFGTASFVDQSCYYPGPYAVDGNPVIWESTPGGVEIHVFTFGDGSRHAIVIGCPGLSTLQPGQPPVTGRDCLVQELP
jgi:hypothetical protein